ncbi:MAG: hypothetical protein KAS32_13600 [Candidatus Peribacteraceae bacterium]|nr:hypothetical protein [Candidatus Peribacteraceae bacterium]
MRTIIIAIFLMALALPAFAIGNANDEEKIKILNMYKEGNKIQGFVRCDWPRNSVCKSDGKFYTWQVYAKRITGFKHLEVAGIEYDVYQNVVTIYYHAVK